MTKSGGRGRRERVLAARQQARADLGRDPNQPGLFDAAPKALTPMPTSEPVKAVADPYAVVERVLSLGEAAARLGVSSAELERMIGAGKIAALGTGFTRMVPTREVERLASSPL